MYFGFLTNTGALDPYTSVESVTINNKTAKATVGDRITLDVTVAPGTASEPELKFETDKPVVAAINDEGVITCLTAGTTTITVTSVSDPRISDSFTLTVEPAPPAPDERGGCGSSVAGASLAAAGLALGLAVLALRKRNKESK